MSETNVPDTDEPVFDAEISPNNGAATGPSWYGSYVKESLRRIGDGETMGAVHAQAITEVVVLLHSIRRILVWTMIIVPLIAAALAVVVIVVGQSQTASKVCGVYSSFDC